jgi:hypothetical protein
MIDQVTPEVVFTAVEAYCVGIGIDSLHPFGETKEDWIQLCEYATSLLAADYQYDDPSPFKVVAAVAVAIGKMAEIPEDLSDAVFAAQGVESATDFHCPRLIPCITGVRVAISLLHNAEVGPWDEMTGDGRKLVNKIKMSKHFYKDLAHTVSRAIRQDTPEIGAIALIFERLAYQFNEGAEDLDRS